MSKHIHAELMAQYAQDAMETNTPWEKWEWREANSNEPWDELEANPTWCEYNEYRRKPRTININGHEVPEPVRSPLNVGTEYWTPHISAGAHTNSATWTEHEFDYARLRNGVIHQTCGAAELHARALLSFTTKLEVSDEYWTCSKCGSDKVSAYAPYWNLETIESYLVCADCGHESKLVFGVIDKKELEPMKDNYTEEDDDV